MTDAEARLQAVLNEQMAKLERALAEAGAADWETVIISYHPEVEEAYIVVLTDGATVEQVREILAPLEEPEHG